MWGLIVAAPCKHVLFDIHFQFVRRRPVAAPAPICPSLASANSNSMTEWVSNSHGKPNTRHIHAQHKHNYDQPRPLPHPPDSAPHLAHAQAYREAEDWLLSNLPHSLQGFAGSPTG